MKRTIFILLLTLPIACGKKASTSQEKIIGKWYVYQFEMKGGRQGPEDFEPGEWIFEFSRDGKFIQTRSGVFEPAKRFPADYKIKNDTELWITDKDRQIPYKIVALTTTHLELDSENENVKLQKR